MRIFVSCSSSDYIDDKYKQMGRDLGKFIGQFDHTLVFGSSESGIMGEVYKITKKYGGKVIAIIPKTAYGVLEKVECDQLIEVDGEFDQFRNLIVNNDVMVVLPGSAGMLAELCLAIHHNKFLEVRKKIIIVNQYGFFDEILKTFNKFIEEKFAYDVSYDLYDVVGNVEEAIEILKEYR